MALLAITVAILTVALVALAFAFFKKSGEQQRAREFEREEREQAFLLELRQMREAQIKNEASQGSSQKQIEGMRQSLDIKIKEVNDRLNSAAEAFTTVSHGLGRLDKLGESVEGLQSLLGSQKLRGGLGEQVMADILKDFVPPERRSTQVTLKSGTRVDAVVYTSAGMIPIDAKFPLENYQKAFDAADEAERERALNELHKNARKHVRDVASKYICPGETVDFAVMYVPSDSVFAAIKEDVQIEADAIKKRVFMVSPGMFCTLLSLVMLNLEGERMAGEARNVMAALRGVQQFADKFGEQLRVSAEHVRRAYNSIGEADKQWERLRGSIDSAAALDGNTGLAALEGGDAESGTEEAFELGQPSEVHQLKVG